MKPELFPRENSGWLDTRTGEFKVFNGKSWIGTGIVIPSFSTNRSNLGGVHRVYLAEMPPSNPEIGTQWLDTRANVVMEWNGMYWFVTENENDDA